jgi:hypothetical protein
MLSFGLAVAVAFPPFATAVLGVPLRTTYGAPFFPLCVAAGLLVGLLNYVIFRTVVYRYLQHVSDKIDDFRAG